MRTDFRHVVARRTVAWALLLIVPLALAGCYRSIGGQLEPTPFNVSAVQPLTETPIVQPTLTVAEAIPTAEEMTPLPTDLPTLTPFPTLGPDTLTPTDTGLGEGQGGPVMDATYFTVVAPSATPVIVPLQPTFTPYPTNTAVPPTSAPTNTLYSAPVQPTITPSWTSVPPTNTPVPPTNTPYPTATPFPTNTSQPTRTWTPAFGPTQTFTPVPFITFAPSATYTPYVPSAGYLPGGVSVAAAAAPGEAQPLAERPQDTLVQTQDYGVGGPIYTLTPYVVAVAPTFTPVAPTFTPLPTEDLQAQAIAQAPTLNPQQVMATQIVYEATATAAAQFGLPAPALPTTMYVPGQVVEPGQVQQGVPTPIDQSGGGPVYIYVTATPVGSVGVCNEYLVMPGDTLSRIAATFGVTSAQIAQANNITNADLIQAGDTLQIPCQVALTPTPIVTPFTPDGTGGRAGVYIVQAGDNIYRISLQFGVTMAELMAANGITAAGMNSIYVGQELIIPASANVPTATPIAGQGGGPVYIVVTATPAYIYVTPTPIGGGAAG